MARYTISQGLTDGTSEVIRGLQFTRKEDAVRIARHLACTNTAADVTTLYVDDDDGGCVFHKPAQRAS